MRFTRILFNVGEKISKARGVLSVEVGASEKEIHHSYLTKAKLYHPDSTQLVNGKTLNADEKRILFDEISEAYDLLIRTDPEDKGSVVDAHEITESGFPKVSSIAYAKNILGVEPFASVDEVNEAYTKLCLLYHPDLADDEDLIDIDYFNTVTQAYQTFQNQRILTEKQVFYEDVIADSDFTISGRRNVTKSRSLDEESFFGIDIKTQLKPSAIFDSLLRFGRDARQDMENRPKESTQWKK